MLIKRLLTGLVAIPLVTLLVYWGSEQVFLLLIMLTAGLSLIEFYKMNFTGNSFITVILIIMGLSCIVFIYSYRSAFSLKTHDLFNLYFTWALLFITSSVILSLLIQLIVFPRNVLCTSNLLIAFVGIIYVCLFLSYLVLLRCMMGGQNWVFFTLLSVWSGDIGAYAVGKTLGSHKLSPLISPHKTIEGALGSIGTVVLAALSLNCLLLKEISITHCILLALGMAVISQVGDLCESAFKRMHNLKDSGNFLPGHGGMLDRIDSLLLAAPLVYYYKVLIL